MTDRALASATISPMTCSRSSALWNLQPIVWREASAQRFQWRQVDRFSLTASTTASATCADYIERDVIGAQERRRQGTGAPLAGDLTGPLGGARPKDLTRPSSPLLSEVRQRSDGLLGPGRQSRDGPESDDGRGGRALAVVADVRLDEAILLEVDAA